ncbi:hypothetical protein B0I35DRAFT_418404 [Stachybotrys elegans]|uniref:Uncharacterized protein n=1 Tax=Stachybotrys elegans TaxID=80388 RepID=A0A8K0T7K0_9HYPO|nr:hypothetical protein B0I35DRAFT_418404 [Stachybotrys elegans]
MIETFVTKVKHASILAKRMDAPLLLLVFCHGLENYELLLDNKRGLKIPDLKGAIEPGCRITLVTTACYSGGWIVDPSFNYTTLAAADEDEQSISWLKSMSLDRFCGSIFASIIIDTLVDVTSPLLEDREATSSAENMQPEKPHLTYYGQEILQPEKPSARQTQTYNQFCRNILAVCRSRMNGLWDQQAFTFDAQDDAWEYTGRAGIPLAYFKDRWDRLPAATGLPQSGGLAAGGNTTSIRRRAEAMASMLLSSCPGDWDHGTSVSFRTSLRDFINGVTYDEDSSDADERDFLTPEEVISTVEYRWELFALADRMVEHFQLPRPLNSSCAALDWDEWESKTYHWESKTFRQTRDYKRVFYKSLWAQLKVMGRMTDPMEDQGPQFDRPRRYMCAAMMDSGKPFDECMAIAEEICEMVAFLKDGMQKTVLEDPHVRKSARLWFTTLRRRMRSLSPTRGHRAQSDYALESPES